MTNTKSQKERWNNIRTIIDTQKRLNTSSQLYNYVYVKKSAYDNKFNSSNDRGEKRNSSVRLLGENSIDVESSEQTADSKKTVYIYLMGPDGPMYENYNGKLRIKVYTPVCKKVPKEAINKYNTIFYYIFSEEPNNYKFNRRI